ncbi:hypothetical protein B0J12DRAFT_569208 [Macrophomina phaseolina]|uniref:C2 domain-containing protein n=1 Tax=Macrophomina phaseolina TaxID=35725 RepID=A0ABQ8GJH8_9PEZI|nr:hypothetical protein B0J12DRAFT_569208 [Macrophomina phaseolina]
MGKQDPYCAARLGKEAKKTETDRRGGQTPKWDQELRFTVRDSPDYYQMKVSVFNDDKKTELIGETFIRLDEVIVPGGGQSDTWHGLHCKGKYAGEIRLELTYYDTRQPAERPVTDRRREHTPVKRRPLPTNPAAATESPITAAEIPPPSKTTRVLHTPPYAQQTLRQSRSIDNGQAPSGLPFSPDDYDVYHQRPESSEDIYGGHYPVQPVAPHQQTSTHARHLSMVPQRAPHPSGHDSRARPLSYMDVPHSHSAPAVPTYNGSPESALDRRTQYPPEVPPLNDHHSDMALTNFPPEQDQRHYPAYGAAYRMPRSAMQPTVEDEDDAAPPPPPMHRSSAPATVPQAPDYPDMTPLPLNVGERRYTNSRGSGSPGLPSYASDSSRPSSRDDPYAVPSALVPGSASTDPRMSTHQHRMSVSAYPPSANGYGSQQACPPIYGTPPRQLAQLEYHTPPRSSPMSYPESAPAYSHSYQGSPQDAMQLVKPLAVSPVASHYDSRQPRIVNRSTPTRKSVSPRPTTSDGPRAPFGPDSFDTYNPRASPRNQNQSRDMDINSRDEHGNIVTPDGRKIDPSDHLPVDSWAPEPEPKGKDRDRKPAIRERDRLTGARELGSRTADRAIREAVTGTFGGSIENPPAPMPATRRLQKRINVQPLRERENFGGYGGSPGAYAGNGAPPIPAKVPLNDGMGAEDLMALSEELKGIDIGASPASARGKWRRRG